VVSATENITAGVVSLQAVTDSNGVVSAQSSFINASAFLFESNATSDDQAFSILFLVNYTDIQEVYSAEYVFGDSNAQLYEYINVTDYNDSAVIFKQVPGAKVVAQQDSLRKVSASTQVNKRVAVTQNAKTYINVG
jgi:hypothetical protein